jgi:hypothetical protein
VCRRLLSVGETIPRGTGLRIVSRARMTPANVSLVGLTFRFVSPTGLTPLDPGILECDYTRPGRRARPVRPAVRPVWGGCSGRGPHAAPH